MDNSITASVTFSFKGETYTPAVRIDLDDVMRKAIEIDPGGKSIWIYNMLAASSNIDTYSYAYEVMLATDVTYSKAMGLAVNHLKEGVFDFCAFQKDWQYQQDLVIAQEIAQKHMAVTDLEQQPQLRDALLDALQRRIP